MKTVKGTILSTAMIATALMTFPAVAGKPAFPPDPISVLDEAKAYTDEQLGKEAQVRESADATEADARKGEDLALGVKILALAGKVEAGTLLISGAAFIPVAGGGRDMHSDGCFYSTDGQPLIAALQVPVNLKITSIKARVYSDKFISGDLRVGIHVVSANGASESEVTGVDDQVFGWHTLTMTLPEGYVLISDYQFYFLKFTPQIIVDEYPDQRICGVRMEYTR
jgi:hypothetical protein